MLLIHQKYGSQVKTTLLPVGHLATFAGLSAFTIGGGKGCWHQWGRKKWGWLNTLQCIGYLPTTELAHPKGQQCQCFAITSGYLKREAWSFTTKNSCYFREPEWTLIAFLQQKTERNFKIASQDAFIFSLVSWCRALWLLQCAWDVL